MGGGVVLAARESDSQKRGKSRSKNRGEGGERPLRERKVC
jgi:hypothetical protein